MTNLKVVQGPKTLIVEKNKREEYHLSIREYQGYRLLNCHVWYKADDGQMRPGKNDLSVRVEKARDVLAAMNEVLSDAGF